MKNLKNNRKSRYKIISLTSLSTIALSALLGDAVRSSAMLGRLRLPSISSMKSITSTGSGNSVISAASRIQGGINGKPSVKVPQTDIAGRFRANSPSSSSLNYDKFNSSLLPGSKKIQSPLSTGIGGTSSTGVGGVSSGKVQGFGSSGGASSGTTQGVTSSTGSTPGGISKSPSSGSLGFTGVGGRRGSTTSTTGSQAPKPVAGNGSVVNGGDDITTLPTGSGLQRRGSTSSTNAWDSSSQVGDGEGLGVTGVGGRRGSITSTTGGQSPIPVRGNGSIINGGDGITPLPTGSGLQRRGSTSSTSSWDSSSQVGDGAGAGTSSRRGSLGFIDGSRDPDAERRAKINKRLKWAGVGVLGLGAIIGTGIGIGVAESNKNKNNTGTENGVPPKNVPIPEKPQYSISNVSSPAGYLYTDE